MALRLNPYIQSHTYFFDILNSFSGKFRQYDYGPNGNLAKYKSSTPPDYNLKKVTAPGYLFYASNDLVVDYKIDIPKLYGALGNCRGKFLIPVPSFNHLDFVYGISAPSVVNSNIIKLFNGQQLN